MRLGWPGDQTFQPEPPQIVGHLASGVFGAGDAEQISDEVPQIAIVEPVD